MMYIVPVFSTVGSAIAWMFVKYGKKKILICQWIIMILAVIILMLRHYEALLIGRILVGLSFGITNAISPIFIKDINPETNQGPMIALIQLWINFGHISSLSLAFLLPQFFRPNYEVDDYWGPIDNTYIAWREILGFPVIIAIIQLLAFIFIFKKEDPLFEEYIQFQNSSFQSDFSMNSEEISQGYNIQQANWTPTSRLERDTWKRLWRQTELRKVFSGTVLRVLYQFTGINIALNFSFFFRFTPNNMYFNLRLIVTWFSIIATFGAMYLLKNGKRKPILLAGSLIAWVCWWIIFQCFGEISSLDMTIGVLESLPNLIMMTTIVIFTTGFWFTSASAVYVYSAEILTDKGMAIASATHWATNTFISLMPNFGISILRESGESVYFHDENSISFFAFSGISICGFFLITIFIKETKGRTKREISKDFRRSHFEALVEHDS